MRTNGSGDWGLRSRTCLIGAACAAIAAGARLLEESSGADVQFMPLLSSMPGWLVSDVTVLVAGIVGGAIGQIACAVVVRLKQEL